MIKLYKILFLSTLMMSTLITISAQSWMGMWIGLEINLLSFIPLMNNSKNMMETESSIKYFIVQALASTVLLLSIILMSMKIFEINSTYSMMLNSALFTKMGAAPFHYWFPEVIEGLTWMNSLILLVWQKIAPMVMIMYSPDNKFFSLIIICCMLISGLMSINQLSLRKIMAYSSINHIGWMISALMFMETVWMYYFIIYSVITINIVVIMNNYNIFYLKQLFNMNNSMVKLFFMVNFMSLGGLPPFLGFLPKWITIQTLVMNSTFMIPLLMILMTLIMLFVYMRITFSTLLLSSNEIKQMTKTTINNNILITFNFITITSLIYCTMMFNLI